MDAVQRTLQNSKALPKILPSAEMCLDLHFHRLFFFFKQTKMEIFFKNDKTPGPVAAEQAQIISPPPPCFTVGVCADILRLVF